MQITAGCLLIGNVEYTEDNMGFAVVVEEGRSKHALDSVAEMWQVSGSTHDEYHGLQAAYRCLSWIERIPCVPYMYCACPCGAHLHRIAWAYIYSAQLSVVSARLLLGVCQCPHSDDPKVPREELKRCCHSDIQIIANKLRDMPRSVPSAAKMRDAMAK